MVLHVVYKPSVPHGLLYESMRHAMSLRFIWLTDIDFGGVGALVADVDAGGEGGGGDGLALEGEVFGFLIRQVGCGVGDG